MTTQISLAGLDGGGRALTFRADQNPDTSVAMRSSLEVQGVAVGPTAPMPVAMMALSSSFSQTLEASHVLKSSAGTIYSFQANATQAGWFMLFDAASAPSDGTVIPKKVWQVTQPVTLDKTFSPPLAMSAGVTLVFSSTGPFLKTAAAFAQFSGEVA